MENKNGAIPDKIAPKNVESTTVKDTKTPLSISTKRIDEIINSVQTEVSAIAKKRIKEEEIKGLFVVKPANKWIEQAKERPIPQMLFGEFWFEGELCILFADTNLGKSILAVQIGNSISKGEKIAGFKMETQKQSVLYFDFELSDKQFENRYSLNYENHYDFDENLIRVEIDTEMEVPETQTFEEYLIESLEKCIIETKAKVVIVDNITYLKSETEKARDAKPLMQLLNGLKKKYQLSMLVLAHTPKRDNTRPITENDIQGSKMLANFMDSSFAIGLSHSDKNVRYIKQIKQRNVEKIYDSKNVVICQVNKQQNFLQFEFVGFGSEREHLKDLSEKENNDIVDKVKDLSTQGRTQRQISSELGISLGSVNKFLNMQ